MTRFSELKLDADGKLVETHIRVIKQSDMLKCPHVILMADHYRADGICRCDDPTATEMNDWGYRWRDGRWRVQDEGLED
jgi:hypothetical protein